jgi:4-amino-4-deoxy-L-arabinose transferase-like glycosyltransferase
MSGHPLRNHSIWNLLRRTPWVPVLLVLVTVYGALLRFDVFVQRYGTLDHPWWARVVTQDIAPLARHLHPSAYRWYHVDQPYVGGDPINYIKYAREMRSFYQAHVREPIFLALTRTYLWVLADQDVAVSFASMTGSIVTIIAAYLLGTAMLSRLAGVVLSFILAMEYELISWSVDGWRDDVFMATVTFSAWAFVRCQRDPSRKNAVFLGVATAAACLTRITALSFVLPGFAWLIVDRGGQTRPQRARMVTAGALLCALIVAPYLVNCAIATGDPLYAINYHTRYYRAGEGLPAEKPMSAAAYVAEKVHRRPIAALDTAVTGLFVQPFRVKWTGLDGWIPGTRTVLSWLSIVGLLRWAFLPEGRMLLVVLIGSLVPYALTWNVAGGSEWRFTMHAYPLYLTASLSGAVFCWQLALGLWRRPWRMGMATRRSLLRWLAGAAVIAAVTAAYASLPWFVVRETIAAGTDVSVEAGGRDAMFFSAGWSQPYTDGRTFRVSRADRAVVRIPLPERRAYQVVLRLDPVAPDRQRRAVVLLNRQLLATLLLTYNPDRVGSYPLLLPADKVRVGTNELTIVPDVLVAAGSASIRFASRDPTVLLGVRLWYVRVLAPPATQATGLVPSQALRRSIQVVQTEAEFHQADVVFAARTLEPNSSFEIDVKSANHDHVDFACLNEFVQLWLATKHGIPLEPQTSRSGVVVNEPNHLEPFDRMSEQFTENERPSLPGSVNNQSKARTPSTGVFTNQPE